MHIARGHSVQEEEEHSKLNCERVFAATSAVSVEATDRKPLFFIFVCSDIDCAFFTKHRHTDKTQSPFVVLWV